MVIDVFSKFGWIKLLKNKKIDIVIIVFDEVFKKRKLKMIWIDKGSEFVSKYFKDFLKKNKIILYYIDNEEKLSIIERWNKIIKNKMCWKMFSVNNNIVYWNKFDKLVGDYNKIWYFSIGMILINVSKKGKWRKSI